MKEVKLVNCLVDEENCKSLLNPKNEIEKLKERFHSCTSEFVSHDTWSGYDSENQKVYGCQGKYSDATSKDVIIKGNTGMIPFIVTMDGKILAVAGKTARDVIFKTSKGNIKGVVTYNFIYKGVVAIRKNPRNEGIEESGSNKHDFFRAVERFENGVFSDRVKDLSGIEINQLPSNEYRLWVYGPCSHVNDVMLKNGDRNGNDRILENGEKYTPDIDRYAMCQISKAKSPDSGHVPMSTAVGKIVGAYGSRVKYFMIDNEGRWVETSYPEINYKLLGNSGVMDATVERKIVVESDSEDESGRVELKSIYTKGALEYVANKHRQFCMNTDIVNAEILNNMEDGVNFTRIGRNFSNKAKDIGDMKTIIRHIKNSQKEQSINGQFIQYTFVLARCMRKYNIEYRVKYDIDCLNLKNGTYSENKPVLDAKVEDNTLVLTIHAHKSERNSELKLKQLFE